MQPGARQMSSRPTTALTVQHLDGDRFRIDVRGHTLTVDQPVEDGGADTAATPTELMVASLAACVAFYARRYLFRHGLPTDGLAVRTSYTMGFRPARVATISLDVVLPGGVPAERREALLAVASHCTVHNTLTTPPDVTVALTASTPAAPG
jgi:putative redox protein